MVRFINVGKSVAPTVKHLPDEGDVVPERPLKVMAQRGYSRVPIVRIMKMKKHPKCFV